MDASSVDLKKTVNLPKTDFPMKANLAPNEPKILSNNGKSAGLYQRIREARTGTADITSCMMGRPMPTATFTSEHAFNKVLKDFIVKSKTMAGYDCALCARAGIATACPIEIKVDQQFGQTQSYDDGGANPRGVPCIRR